MGASPVGRGRVDREQIVAVFSATGSIKAAGKASGVCSPTARRVLVAEGLVGEARRPHQKVQAKRRFLELVDSGWSARRAAAFLALLDPDRFEGQYRAGVHSTDSTGLMRRMVKEQLLTFEGKPLFPERIAETMPYHRMGFLVVGL
jgi:hypothetical protein